jgi:aspartate ammonia-lyase
MVDSGSEGVPPTLLASQGLFRDLDAEEREYLAARLFRRSLAAGRLLFEENTPRRELSLIVEGDVELVKTDRFRGNRRVIVFKPGDFLGEGALVGEQPHSTTARTLTPGVILVLTATAFQELVATRPAITTKILLRIGSVLLRRMQQATHKVMQSDGTTFYASGRTRREHDLLGELDVPQDVYYGIQTLRGLQNFHVTGVPLSHYPALIRALAVVKIAAARANAELGELPAGVAAAIEQAGQEILLGELHEHFVLDMIQGGAGTSTNMNANEVLANRASEILGGARGSYQPVHPNNHVNKSQSTNDAYPTALKLAICDSNQVLLEALSKLIAAFRRKGVEFADVLKMGRTQLQDAVPMTLGQEFEAYAATLGEEIERLSDNVRLFFEVNMGGTAIGTGIAANAQFAEKVVPHLRALTGYDIVSAPNLVESTQDTGSFVMYSSALKRLAVKLSKICNDLRLLSSGPRTGFNEINLPPMQPGSSIMPGKVNPVIPEVVNQIAFKVIGNDLTVTLAAEAGQLELNVMEPVIAQSILESIEILRNGILTLESRCIQGITANREVCLDYLRRSIGLVTALVPTLGYELATELARDALITGRGIYDLVLERNLLSKEALDDLLDPLKMVGPQRESAPV